MNAIHYQRILDKCKIFSVPPTEFLLHVDIGSQTLTGYHQGRLLLSYTVSTSRQPPSCMEDSLGTPLGLHRIDGKIGAGQPHGMIFKGRVPQGHTYHQLSGPANSPNLITTRILRLRGLEPGVNRGAGRDSYDRYIYIHGTNHEDRLGTPDSHGCVLMANSAVAELFDRVADGTRVWIEA